MTRFVLDAPMTALDRVSAEASSPEDFLRVVDPTSAPLLSVSPTSSEVLRLATVRGQRDCPHVTTWDVWGPQGRLVARVELESWYRA